MSLSLNPWQSEVNAVATAAASSGSPYPVSAMPRSKAHALAKRPPEFEQEVAKLLVRLQGAYAELLRALPGPIESGADLQRATKLDMKICWKVHRVVTAPDALSAAPYVLGPANTESFLKAVQAHGAPEATVRTAERCSEQLRVLIREHAGDRKTFESMVSTWSSSPQERVNQRERKAAFKATSHIFGVAVDTMVICTAIRPSPGDPRRLDKLALGGEFGLRRLRRTSVPLFAKWIHPFDDLTDSDGKPARTPGGEIRSRRRPIGQPSRHDDGLGLLTNFCSVPTPELISTKLADGRYMVELTHDRVGSKAAVDIALGMMIENTPWRYRVDNDAWNICGTIVNKPCQVAVIDLLIERGTYDRIALDGCMTTARLGPASGPQDVEASGRLEDDRQVACLGRGAEVLGFAEVPRYRSMVEWTFEQAGWDIDTFDVYRYRVEYPITLSTVFASYELPVEPS